MVGAASSLAESLGDASSGTITPQFLASRVPTPIQSGNELYAELALLTPPLYLDALPRATVQVLLLYTVDGCATGGTTC